MAWHVAPSTRRGRGTRCQREQREENKGRRKSTSGNLLLLRVLLASLVVRGRDKAPPLLVLRDDLIDERDVGEAPPLRLADLLGVATLVGSYRINVEGHFCVLSRVWGVFLS